MIVWVTLFEGCLLAGKMIILMGSFSRYVKYVQDEESILVALEKLARYHPNHTEIVANELVQEVITFRCFVFSNEDVLLSTCLKF